MKAFRGLLARACAPLLAMFMAAPSFAQQVPDQAYRPDGVRVPTGASVIVVYDTSTGLPCVLGSAPTCVLATSAPVGGALETTQLAVKSDLDTLNTNFTTLNNTLTGPAPTSAPPETPVASSNTDVTQLYPGNITASGDTTLVSATSGQSTRIHRLECSILPTSGSVTVTFKSATNVIRAIDFPSTGGVLQWIYSPYWYVKTNNNEALIINFSTAGNYKCTLLYVKGA